MQKFQECLLKKRKATNQVVTDEPKPGFKSLTVMVLDNMGINTATQVCAARAAVDTADTTAVAVPPNEPCLVKAYEDKIVYDVTVELPDAGLIAPDEYYENNNNEEIEADTCAVTPPHGGSGVASCVNRVNVYCLGCSSSG